MVTGSSTPKKAASTRRTNVNDDQNNDPKDPNAPEPTQAPTVEETQPTENATASGANDEEDVKALLARRTFDGKGDAAVPPSNFKSFATEGVEKKPLKSVEDVAQEVLHGNWGPNAATVSERLHAAGYDVLEVEKEYNKRKAAGAPSALS